MTEQTTYKEMKFSTFITMLRRKVKTLNELGYAVTVEEYKYGGYKFRVSYGSRRHTFNGDDFINLSIPHIIKWVDKI